MNNICKEYKKCDGISVLSDTGWIPIDYVIKTIPMKKYIVLFESGIEIQCADKHAFININYEPVTANNLTIGDKVISAYGFDVVFDVFETDEYCEMYDLNLPYHNLYYSNDILSHNSAMLTNLASRQVLNGHNVVIITLELSEDSVAQRMDAIYSCIDINKLYIIKDNTRTLIRKLSDINDNTNIGKLYIKEFPTGEASVIDIKRYLRELKMRGINPDIIYVDYINLMKSSVKNISDLYGNVKKIAEELRALSFQFEAPVVSVSQLNREGSNIINLRELDFTYISECIDPNSLVEKYVDGEYKNVKLCELSIGDYIRGENGPVKVKNIFPYKKKKLYKIRTKSGKEIICSDKHIFPTEEGNLSISSGLKVGKKLFVKKT